MKKFFKLYWDNVKIDHTQLKSLFNNLAIFGIIILGVLIIMVPTLKLVAFSFPLAIFYYIVSTRVMYGLVVTLSELDILP